MTNQVDLTLPKEALQRCAFVFVRLLLKKTEKPSSEAVFYERPRLEAVEDGELHKRGPSLSFPFWGRGRKEVHKIPWDTQNEFHHHEG